MKIDSKFIILLLFSLVLLLTIGGNMLTVIVLALILILVFALIIFVIYQSNIEVKLKSGKEKISVNSNDSYAIEISNNSIFFVPDIIVESKKDKSVTLLNMNGKSKKRIEYPFSSKIRGIYQPDSIVLSIKDIFNIFTSKIETSFSKIKVYPIVKEKLEDSPVTNYLMDGKFNKNYYLENQYISRDLRRYIPGDNIRKINWKVSAKLSDLYIKKDEESEERQIKVVLDLNKSILEKDITGVYENQLVSDALTFSNELLKNEIAHEFVFNNNNMDNYFLKREEDINIIIEKSLENKANLDITLNNYYLNKKNVMGQNDSYFVFTIFSEENFDALTKIKNEKNKVIVLTPKESFDYYASKQSTLELHALIGGEYGQV